MKYQENLERAKKLNTWAVILSVVVIGAVVGMRYFKFNIEADLSFLPAFHSTVNGLTGIVLLIALWFIKQKKIEAHKRTILVAMFLSLIFLLSYVTYHITQEEVLFCKEGTIRTVYFFLLITHIISAAIIFPFVLFTFVRGFTYQVAKHKKMARWVFPIWLYVCITGPICYILLRPCF